MDLQIVNADPTYTPVRLSAPTTRGYIHVAAEVRPPSRPGPVIFHAINHARWDGSLPRVLFAQLSKKSFRTYVLTNLEANRVGAMPVLYRRA